MTNKSIPHDTKKDKESPSTYARVLVRNIPKESWADTMESDTNTQSTNEENKTKECDAISMFSISSTEAPFLVGVKGRNISLIRKYSGMLITINNGVVYMSPSRKTYDIELAWKLVLSACYGGILRWFENPYATKKGYPPDRYEELNNLAASHQFDLMLLRSRKGHMCLVLIPQFKVPGENINDCPTSTDLDFFRNKIQTARQHVLNALNVRNN
jgi:hypothetical protein